MNVWVVTVGKDESFNSVWVTKKLAWRHAQKMAREFALAGEKTQRNKSMRAKVRKTC